MTGAAAREALAARLRARVAEGCYAEARQALGEYCQAVREAALGMAPGDPALGHLAAEWTETAEEIRRRVLAGRSHAAARLARIPRLPEPYGPCSPGRRWRCFA